MPVVEAERIEFAALAAGDIDCECMVCHLPLDQMHGPVEWKLTFRFPGPYPKPGVATMLLCDPCYRDWTEHGDELGGHPEFSHRV